MKLCAALYSSRTLSFLMVMVLSGVFTLHVKAQWEDKDEIQWFRKGFYSYGVSFGIQSVNNEKLNQSLMLSGIPPLQGTMPTVDCMLTIDAGKGFLVSEHLQYIFPIQSTFKDQDGTFTTSLSQGGPLPIDFIVTLGYIAYREGPVMIVPKVGASLGEYYTAISLDRINDSARAFPGNPGGTRSIRARLTESSNTVLENWLGGAQLIGGLECYITLSKLENRKTMCGNYVPLESTLLLCGYVNFHTNVYHTSSLDREYGQHQGVLFPTAPIDFFPSGFSFGLRLTVAEL